MKHKNLLLTVLAVIMIAAMAMFGTACETTSTSGSGDNTTDGYTVTFYRGTETLKTVTVAEGGKVESWTPEIENHEFMGWFAEASLAIPFDFNAVITEDTDVFGAFRENVYVEDVNAYYAIGTGSGELKDSNWNHGASASALPLVKDTNVTNANVYTVEIDMYAGDRFQICYGGGWSGQQGIGYVKGFEYCAGVNPYGGKEVTAEDRDYGEVKDANGKVVFIGGNENDNGAESWNIILNDGCDGTYKFTLTTYPNASSYNVITWELVKTLEPQKETHKMYLSGTMNEWSKKEVTDAHQMTKSTDGSYWYIIYTVTEADYADWTVDQGPFDEECAAFKVKNAISNSDYGVDGGTANFYCKAGTYAIKYTVDTNMVEVEELAYYIVGTFIGENNEIVNFSVKAGVTPKFEVVDDVLTATLTVVDVTVDNSYNWLAEKKDANGNAAVFAVKVVFGSSIAIKDWYGAADGDNFYLTAGTYTVTFDPTTGTVTIAEITNSKRERGLAPLK